MLSHISLEKLYAHVKYTEYIDCMTACFILHNEHTKYVTWFMMPENKNM